LSQKLNHAYLFGGPPEVGKLTVAKFFANQILCQNQACGECSICKQIKNNICSELTIVDELWIEDLNEDWDYLAKKSNFNQLHRSKAPKAKTDTIGIEDLRELLGRIHTTHTGWQIFIIHNIERLTHEAANNFLKTLEEPPPRTIFILTTNNLALLLPTIISRCRVLQFGNVNPSAIEKMLQRDFPSLTPEETIRIVNFSMGKPIRAARLAADPDLYRNYAEYFRRLKGLFERPDTFSRMRFAEEATTSNPETQKFLEALTYFLRSFMLTRAREPSQTSRYNPEKIVKLIEQCELTRQLIDRNVNPRLAVENLLLSI
jgi:DNA polymerase-3 subunit delta'